MHRRWKSREQELGVQGATLVERFLKSRGFVSKADSDSFINPRLSDLKNPFTLKGMDQAVDRLSVALKNQEWVCVYGDFDLDGTSGLALLYEGLRELGFKNLKVFQPLRLKEGYGFHDWAVEELAQQGVSLILTVDVGITAFLATERANQLGVDVIITDHHLPADQGLPAAYCIVNPNQGSCPSELGYLSGAGVAFYVIRALLRRLTDLSLIQSKGLFLNSLLEFVVIATITDMVPMKGDNRAMIKAGLKQLKQTQRAGLRALLMMLGLDQKELSASDVAIRIAPKLNALSRMELDLRPVDIFLEESIDKAQELMTKVSEQNSMRVNLQQEGEAIAIVQAQEQLTQDFIFVYDARFHRGVIGLIATKLAKDLNKPTFIGALDKEGNITGSARLPDGHSIGLTEALQSVGSHLMRYGGHFAAAGFELSHSKVNEFSSGLALFFKSAQDEQLIRFIDYDLDLNPEDISLKSHAEMSQLEPFGVGFEPPLFSLKNMVTVQVKELKGGHLKAWLSPKDQKGPKIEALGFSLSAEMKLKLRNQEQPKNILFELQKNEFKGHSAAQIRIVDIQYI